jgi:hypothetical protein
VDVEAAGSFGRGGLLWKGGEKTNAECEVT